MSKRLAGAPTGDRGERELADELESHIEMQVEDSLRAGMMPEEAARRGAAYVWQCDFGRRELSPTCATRCVGCSKVLDSLW